MTRYEEGIVTREGGIPVGNMVFQIDDSSFQHNFA